MGGTFPALLAESRTVFVPKFSDVDNNGGIVISPEALRPLTLCNCDCKILTTTICRFLHWYTRWCFHPSQRCISSGQITDDTFEIETTAFAHVACAPRESVFFFLIDSFSCRISQSFLDLHCTGKTEFSEFICCFLRRIYYDSTTHVEFGGMIRGQFPMARGVRQGCPASVFLFAMAFDFLQLAQCAYADDFAAAAPSFRCLMTALALAFQAVDRKAGLHLNHRKCCLVQYGSERREYL